jgi:hypothetical protein
VHWLTALYLKPQDERIDEDGAVMAVGIDSAKNSTGEILPKLIPAPCVPLYFAELLYCEAAYLTRRDV